MLILHFLLCLRSFDIFLASKTLALVGGSMAAVSQLIGLRFLFSFVFLVCTEVFNSDFNLEFYVYVSRICFLKCAEHNCRWIEATHGFCWPMSFLISFPLMGLRTQLVTWCWQETKTDTGHFPPARIGLELRNVNCFWPKRRMCSSACLRFQKWRRKVHFVKNRKGGNRNRCRFLARQLHVWSELGMHTHFSSTRCERSASPLNFCSLFLCFLLEQVSSESVLWWWEWILAVHISWGLFQIFPFPFLWPNAS